MIKVILAKLAMLIFGTGKRATRFLFSVGFLIVIAIFWKHKELLIIFISTVVLYSLISKFIPKKPENKLDDIKDLLELKKFEKALEKIDEVITKDLPKVKEDKRKLIYYRCIYNKASCLWNKAYTSGDTEYLKQSIRLYEEVLGLALEENKPVTYIMSSLGLVYYNLGFLENNKEIIKIAIKVLETALEQDEKKQEKNIASIHTTLGYCYQTLANYCNREEYLIKSLEELEYTFNEISKGKYPYDEAIINISKASALRKLNEVSYDENNKTKAMNQLNDAIKYLNGMYNKHYKKYFARQYAKQRFHVAEAYFEMLKINSSEDYLRVFKEAIKEVKEYCSRENNAYYIKKIDEMLSELKLEV